MNARPDDPHNHKIIDKRTEAGVRYFVECSCGYTLGPLYGQHKAARRLGQHLRGYGIRLEDTAAVSGK